MIKTIAASSGISIAQPLQYPHLLHLVVEAGQQLAKGMQRRFGGSTGPSPAGPQVLHPLGRRIVLRLSIPR